MLIFVLKIITLTKYCNKLTTILLVSLIVFVLTESKGQGSNESEVNLNLSIPPIALINFAVEGDQTITYGYSFSGPNNIEQIIRPNTENNTWINYSSIVAEGLSNYITVHLSSGSLPADVILKLIIGPDVGAGEGNSGTPTSGEILITSYPQNIISSIGNCYTGTGIHKGHQLTYLWENPQSYNYSLKYENGEIIAVTYTISSTQ